jgi:hypothetical protein
MWSGAFSVVIGFGLGLYWAPTITRGWFRLAEYGYAAKSQRGKSQRGKSQSGKSQEGKSQEGKSQEGKSQEGKSQEGKSQEGKSQESWQPRFSSQREFRQAVEADARRLIGGEQP